MPQQVIASVENNFTQGLKTEFTGMNFPENAATDTDNCIYTLVGDVTRRAGINYEENYTLKGINTSYKAISTYLWTNAGGDGETKLLSCQVGSALHFYNATSATTSNPLSANKLAGVIDISGYVIDGITFDASAEATFTDGNGYLIVFHPDCSSFYVSYNPASGSISSSAINIQVRDLIGVSEGNTPVDQRPGTLTDVHQYNLLNQGWTQGSPWVASSSQFFLTNNPTWTSGTVWTWSDVASGLSISVGDVVGIYGTLNGNSTVWVRASGIVTSYSGTTLKVNTFAYSDYAGGTSPYTGCDTWTIQPTNAGFINGWYSAVSNYPSNSDVWWRYKDDTGAFNPTDTYANVSVSSGPAPKGHFLLDAFNQNRALVSGINSITSLVTTARPTNGAWFAGRIWYTGVNGSQAPTGTADYYTWSENIYFSQIIQSANDFGKCYQANDPTDENLFDLLPTDGGVIVVQGAGSIYKLFTIQNGLLVFAQNGIWFVTGSQGIGFTANDYTLTKISSVQNISTTSFVDVQGLPYFWNDEGIYTITPSQQGLGLQVEPLTLNTILSYYDDIPKISKRYVRGDYNPIDYTIQWVFRSEEESGIGNRYAFDKILVYNTANKAFYPYSISGTPVISSVDYIPETGNLNSPEYGFRYFTVTGGNVTFSYEYDEKYLDWYSYDNIGMDYLSYFVTGYKLHGQGQRRFQLGYIYVYSNADVPTAYNIQGIWDYASDRSSGKWTSVQQITNALTRFSRRFRRHKIRGRGLVLQFKVFSVTGLPFDINGWSVQEQQNTGV